MGDVILVRFTSRAEVHDLLNELTANDICYKYIKERNRILLKGCISIFFCVIPAGDNEFDRIKGLRFDGCFGFVDSKVEEYLTGSNNKCKGYSKLIDYILNNTKGETEL